MRGIVFLIWIIILQPACLRRMRLHLYGMIQTSLCACNNTHIFLKVYLLTVLKGHNWLKEGSYQVYEVA